MFRDSVLLYLWYFIIFKEKLAKKRFFSYGKKLNEWKRNVFSEVWKKCFKNFFPLEKYYQLEFSTFVRRVLDWLRITEVEFDELIEKSNTARLKKCEENLNIIRKLDHKNYLLHLFIKLNLLNFVKLIKTFHGYANFPIFFVFLIISLG